MSDKNSESRKVPARILRISALSPSISAPKTVSSYEATSRAAQRGRVSGTPLPNVARNSKPPQQGGKNAFAQAMANMPDATLPSTISDAKETLSASRSLAPSDDLEHGLPPNAIWEQQNYLEFSMEEDAPRWVTNSALNPTAEEFAALGAYIKYMIDGFSVFCRMPSVGESGNWHARLKMPHVVMPDTMLDVNISPLHARLRFETEHRVSRDLLNLYVHQLREQIVLALDDNREVEVLVW